MKIRPMPGWALCRTLPHAEKTAGGIFIPKDVDKEVTSEGVAEVLDITPKRGGSIPFEKGDKIIYRGFLRFCNQVGEMYGEHRACEYFLLNLDDALAVVTGPTTVGLYGEYEVS
jgi:co-chaperonin GroES (HSP10)